VSFVFTPYSLPSLIAALAASGVALYAWSRRTRAGKLFALFSLAAAVWSLAYALEILGANLPTKLAWARLAYVGISLAPPAWLFFSLYYTGRDRALTGRFIALLLLIPLITLLLAFTNELHGLVWASARLDNGGPFLALAVEHGPWFWVFAIYGYIVNLLSVLLVLVTTFRAPRMFHGQAAVLLIGAMLPWLGNIIYLSGLSSVPDWDLTTVTFGLAAVGYAWGVWRYQLLGLMPVPRDTLVDATADGLIVLDNRNRVVDLNPAAQKILGAPATRVVGQPVSAVVALQSILLGETPSPVPARAEVALGPAALPRMYDLSVTSLTNARGEVTGRLIALRDITDRKEAEAALREQKELFENLVAVARATAERPALGATLQNALNVAARIAGAERGSLFLLNPAGVVTHSHLTYRGMTPDQQEDTVRRVMNRGLSGWVVRHREAVLIADTRDDERWLAPAGDVSPIASVLGVPIISGTALVGVLTLSHSQPGLFTEDHLHLMQAAADQMALALRNAQIYEEQRLMARRQAALYGVMRAVGEQLNPPAVATAAVEAIVRLVDGQARWPGVGIALPDRDNGHWVQSAGSGRMHHIVGERYPLTDGVVGRAFATANTQLVPHVQADPDYIAAIAETRSELAVPLRRGERVLGVLNLESDRPEAFDTEDVQLAESLADAVALVLDNAHLYQAIATQSSRLQALIKSSRDGIFMVSTDGRLLVVNAPVLHLLRLSGEPDEWLGRPLAQVFRDMRHYAPGAVRSLLAEVRRLRLGVEPANEGETEVPPRTVHWLSLPVLGGDVPLGRLLVLRDVTEERVVEKMREDLTHTMVHDLRNPLTNIRMALELLNQVSASSGVAETQHAEVLHIALNSTARMLSLVNAILDVNRLESGQMPLVREPVPLHDAVTEVNLMQMPQAMEKQLRLENAVPANLPVPHADAGLIRRVLQNLIGNAIKFTPDGGLVRVSAAAEAGGERVIVTVCDTGPGLPPEIRANLFQKFVTGRHRERGSGLGLAYCRLAIEAHGGRIWTSTEPGWGAIFNFTLPVLNEEE
jgi:signal transduction histidine kinase